MRTSKTDSELCFKSSTTSSLVIFLLPRGHFPSAYVSCMPSTSTISIRVAQCTQLRPEPLLHAQFTVQCPGYSCFAGHIRMRSRGLAKLNIGSRATTSLMLKRAGGAHSQSTLRSFKPKARFSAPTIEPTTEPPDSQNSHVCSARHNRLY